ncbi:D-3-phosphoglycerate dehydrogenase [Indibacter alkaliphilus LW1]|uniref:D-3-phosphoglycerate dehydrogenase n=1 Tax=Indibacter alkaliphilus (strain CCUG 57479 / KCTC 22604 / LW1) TaxID=1189612 RepID=S2DEA3_INDAL|nr:NAD(P)-dependent oxidoreductase [Indibacter alkaliphilus]EOZ95335.1 D-3-phosphoglycerate dehydrogenase [Indibacter alkaliphilus LW1]
MKILVTAPYNKQGLDELSQKFGEVVYKPWKKHGKAYSEGDLLRILEEEKAEGLITEHDEVTSKVIETFNELKFIGVCRGTPSNVAVETAKRYGIPVLNTPARNAQAVAELFVSNVIMLLRNTMESIKWLEARKWDSGSHTSYLQFKGNELAGKKVGMVGFGAVGQHIAKILKNFPCEILYYDPYLEGEFPYTKSELTTIFKDCQIVSVNLPATKTTKNFIDKKLIDKMSPDAVLVNMSRAMVVNRKDLFNALSSNRIRGAVIDVFDHEPPDEADYNLINLDNVLATPHIAGATHEVEDHHVTIMNMALSDYFIEQNNELIKS